MFLGRIAGWLLVALGLVALGGDALTLLQGNSAPVGPVPVDSQAISSQTPGLLASLGEFWLRLDPDGPLRLNAAAPDWLQQALLAWLLPLPAAPVLLVAGLLLVLLFRKRAPKKTRPRFGALA